MLNKIIFIVAVTLTGICEALVSIPQPDMSNSEQAIINTHKKLMEEFEENKSNLDKIKLGAAYGQLGMFYQAHEFNQSAKASYLNAKESSPYDFRWSYLLGFIQATMGEFDSAIENYKTVLSINQEYLPAKIRWAELELEKGNFDVAKKLFLEVLGVAPKYTKALTGLGKIYMQLGQAKKAITQYEAALKLQPKANQLNYFISQAYSSIGDQDQANKFAQNQGQRAVIMYDKILQEMRLHSVSSSYYSQAAINAYMNDDYELAEELIGYSIMLDPENVNPYFTLFNVLVSTKRPNEAIKKASELLIKNPGDDRLAYSIGVINEVMGKDSEATQWYETTLKLNPKHNSAHFVLANSYMRLKEFDKALNVLRSSLSIETENPYIYYAEASILSFQGQCEKAIPLYLKAIKKSSKENFRYLIAFVKTVAVCDNVEPQVKNDALNAARNMYLYSPTWQVVQGLAMIEAGFGHMKDAVDYQAQAIFQALSEKLPKHVVEELKLDLELYKNNKKAINAIKPYDIDINPIRTKSING